MPSLSIQDPTTIALHTRGLGTEAICFEYLLGDKAKFYKDIESQG